MILTDVRRVITMTVKQSLALYGLVPLDSALPQIRALLAHEVECERAGQPREPDLALLCCVQLFARALVEDALRIWETKCSGFDLGCYLDIQLLCGAGLAETKTFLATDGSPAALSALKRIEECESTGDFEGFQAQKVLEHYQQYFGGE
jgi:hypothetical protein